MLNWLQNSEKPKDAIPRAWRVRRSSYWTLGAIVLVVGTLWFTLHVARILGLAEASAYTPVWFVVFGGLLLRLALGWSEETYEVDILEQAEINKLSVDVVVPVYNEDSVSLQRALQALLEQTRLPQRIHVVGNGPYDGSLDEVKTWFLSMAQEYHSVELLWDHIPEPGKRGAQIFAIKHSTSDVIATMDSDTVADPRCIEEGLKPLADPGVASVASVILAYNAESRFVRVTDAWLLSFQLAVRAATSRLGCVLVNSGNFAFYRTAILKKYLKAYGNETFMGRKVEFSDDSLLTLFSYLEGKTVQQPTSFAFTVLPERIWHHLRQQLRWMRGSTIRSIWRFRYLPLDRWGYYENFTAWVNWILVTLAFFFLVILSPFTGTWKVLPIMAFFAITVAYLIGFRYLTIRRSDQSVKSQLLTFALTPVMLAWTAFVLRTLRIFAIFTCANTGWGTRGGDSAEVSIRT